MNQIDTAVRCINSFGAMVFWGIARPLYFARPKISQNTLYWLFWPSISYDREENLTDFATVAPYYSFVQKY